MGRKKNKASREELPWCYYCDRDFENDDVLIQHQKARHFKCQICNKKAFNVPGLAIHTREVRL